MTQDPHFTSPSLKLVWIVLPFSILLLSMENLQLAEKLGFAFCISKARHRDLDLLWVSGKCCSKSCYGRKQFCISQEELGNSWDFHQGFCSQYPILGLGSALTQPYK